MERYQGKPFAIVGVNTDGSAEKARARKLPFRSWADGSPDGPIDRAWNIRAYPTWYLLDRQGRVAVRDADEKGIEAQIDRVLAAP